MRLKSFHGMAMLLVVGKDKQNSRIRELCSRLMELGREGVEDMDMGVALYSKLFWRLFRPSSKVEENPPIMVNSISQLEN